MDIRVSFLTVLLVPLKLLVQFFGRLFFYFLINGIQIFIQSIDKRFNDNYQSDLAIVS